MQVCTVLRTIIPDISNDREAKQRYEEAMGGGKALLTVVNKELAEAYIEQLARADPEIIVYADMEEEK